MSNLEEIIRASIAAKAAMLSEAGLLRTVEQVSEACVAAFRAGGKVLFCGNGGSAADAQHLAAEFSGRFYFDRPPLYAEALHVNTSFLTAVANDYGYEAVYARMVQAAGRRGDVLFAMSTSGNSPNVIRAMVAGRRAGMIIVGMTGQTGGRMQELCDYLINVPSTDTPRIQECHLLLGHAICEQVERTLFRNNE